jgi:hypothetical protein
VINVEGGYENHFSATTLLPEQPKPRRPMTIMVVQNLRFSVGIALAGLAQFRKEEICKPQVWESVPPSHT